MNDTKYHKRILLVGASPENQSKIKYNDEFKRIREEKEKYDEFAYYVIKEIKGDDIAFFRRTCFDFSPYLIHFAGHGNLDGILFEKKISGKTDVVPTKAFGEFFEHLEDTLHCVFLNSCYSTEQARIISGEVPIVIAMSDKVKTRHAENFAVDFYKMLFREDNCLSSFRVACNESAMTKTELKEVVRFYKDGELMPKEQVDDMVAEAKNLIRSKESQIRHLQKAFEASEEKRNELRPQSPYNELLSFIWNTRKSISDKVSSQVMPSKPDFHQASLARSFCRILEQLHDAVLTDRPEDMEHFEVDNAMFDKTTYLFCMRIAIPVFASSCTEMRGWKKFKKYAGLLTDNFIL